MFRKSPTLESALSFCLIYTTLVFLVVTFVKNPGTHNTLWWVRPANHPSEGEYPANQTCQLAEPIPCGTTIRLTHLETMKNLHSHGVKSPLTSQQEVSAYGEGDGKGDGGDK